VSFDSLMRRWWGLIPFVVFQCLVVFSGLSWGLPEEVMDSSAPENIDEAEEHLRLGVEFFLTDELDVAIDEFREAARQEPDYADAYHNLGVALAKTGDLTGGIMAWTEARRLDPQGMSLPYSLSALVSYNYGVSLIRNARLSEAIEEWQVALGLQPNFPEAHYALGLAFLVKNNPAEAVEHLQVTVRTAPDWAEAYEALGLAYFVEHDFHRAKEAWRYALILNQNSAKAHAYLGRLGLEEGNYHEAIEHSRQALELEPDVVLVSFNLGMALLAKGQEQASVTAFAHALNVDARFTPARLLAGVAWSRMGDWAQAASRWREALQQDPFGRETFWLHYNLGIALTSMGQFKNAIKEFRWVVGERPEWVQGWSRLGVALMSERRWGEAVMALETSAQLKPDWAHLHFSLGNAHAAQGELIRAAQAFRQAVRVAPNYVDALFNLGIVLRAQNQLSKAVGPLRQAAEGGSREAQGLLASMYMNGNGMDRNVPLAMLWWARSSRGSIPDTITRTAKNRLAQLRQRISRHALTPIEHQDVLTGFGLIRQDLANYAPFELEAHAWLEEGASWSRISSPGIVLQWMIERALALDELAQRTLREWYVHGVVGHVPPYHPSLRHYWLQVAKEGDQAGCEFIETLRPEGNFHAVRQACQSLRK